MLIFQLLNNQTKFDMTKILPQMSPTKCLTGGLCLYKSADRNPEEEQSGCSHCDTK